MNYKQITGFLFFAGLLLLVACADFLQEQPKDRLPDTGTFNDMQELYLNGIASLYNYMGGCSDSQGLQGSGRGVYDLNTFTTDEAMMSTRGGDWFDGGFWQGLYLHKWGTDNDAIRATWEYLYKVVGLANLSLAKMDAFQQAHPDAATASYRAEVRALRALFYYHLMDLFGRVPLVLSPAPSTKEIVQQPRSKCYAFIVDELLSALPLLPEAPSNRHGTYYGRITRPVVFFLLAKLALNAEVYGDDDWTDKTRPDGKAIYFNWEGKQLNAWEATVAWCDSLTAMGYTLSDDYAENFAVFNENSPENIFVIPMNKHLYTNQMIYLFRSRHYNHAAAYGLGGENGACATLETLHTFGYGTAEADPRFDCCFYADTVYDLSGRPVRLDNGETLVYYPDKVALDVTDTPYEKTAGARMKKYAVDKTATKDGKLMENDIVLFRYADVLLMKSEALVRNGQNGDAELNRVRERVKAPLRTATLQHILDERLLELVWEGWRRQDLVRFELFTRAYSYRPPLEKEADGYTTVFPIPEKIRSLNKNLLQNPGY